MIYNPKVAVLLDKAVRHLWCSQCTEAKVEIPSGDIGFVRAGIGADISIDSFPATDFGVLEGKVQKLGSDALPPEPSKQQLNAVTPQQFLSKVKA